MGFLLHWLMLFGFWLVLSGQFDAFHLAIGIFGAAGVALLSHQLQWFDLGGGGGASRHLAASGFEPATNRLTADRSTS